MQLQILLLRLWLWTTLVCLMLSSPDTLSTTNWICFSGLEYSHGIHGVRPAWPSLIIKVLAFRVKFFELSGYCTLIDYAFTFCTRNVFVRFHNIMAQFKWIKQKFPYVAHSSVQLSNHTRSEVMHNVWVYKLLQYYQQLWVSTTAWTTLVTWYIHKKLTYTKILFNFWFTQVLLFKILFLFLY